MTEERFKTIETTLVRHEANITHILLGQERLDKKHDALSQSLVISMQNMFSDADRRSSERIDGLEKKITQDHAKREGDWQKKGIIKGVVGTVGIPTVIAVITWLASVFITINDDSLTKQQKLDRLKKISVEQLKEIEKLDGEIISKPQEKTE